jgi:hypothetical protein
MAKMPIVPFKDTMTTLEVRDWSRGLATYFPSIKLDAGQFSVLYNMLMEPDRSIKVRPGYDPMDAKDTMDTTFAPFASHTAVSFFKTSDLNTDQDDDDEYRLLALDNGSACKLKIWGHGGLSGTEATELSLSSLRIRLTTRRTSLSVPERMNLSVLRWPVRMQQRLLLA